MKLYGIANFVEQVHLVPYTAYCKSFKVEKFCGCRAKPSFAGKLLRLEPIAQPIAVERFCDTDQSVKTAKLFEFLLE